MDRGRQAALRALRQIGQSPTRTSPVRLCRGGGVRQYGWVFIFIVTPAACGALFDEVASNRA
jgi:hypothetical protein